MDFVTMMAIFCCDGECMVSFYDTKKDGVKSICDSLSFIEKTVDGIHDFYCKNFKYR